MSFQADLRTYLLADPALSAALGPRVAWVQRPQSQGLPALVLHTISRQPSFTTERDLGLDALGVQFDVLAETYGQARTIADRLRHLLSGKSHTLATTEIRGAFPTGERESAEPVSGSPDITFRISIDMDLWVRGA